MRDRMKKPEGLTEDQRFFWEHAGWSYNPKTETKREGRMRGAIALANAEQHARSERWYYTWVEDDDADVSWMDKKARRDYRMGKTKMLGCVLYDSNDEVLASLWAIHVSGRGDAYCRVVEAELALEAIP